jgi:hypothetical protein
MTPPSGGAGPPPRRRSCLPRRILIAAGLSLVAATGCFRHPEMSPAPVPEPGAPEMAIYRTVAESVYVRTTGRSVGIVTTPLDTACLAEACRPFMTRWGLDPLWWTASDSADAVATRNDLLSRIATPMSLAGVALGQALLQSIAPDSAAMVTAQPDTAHWKAFKERHGGASGFLWFSPIGFNPAHRSALVYVDWQCGPDCGHTAAVALRSNDAGAWHIDDMLLISSRTPRALR